MNKGVIWGALIAVIIILVLLYVAFGGKKAEAPSGANTAENNPAPTTEVNLNSNPLSMGTENNGLVITDLRVGTGTPAATRDIVIVNYAGTLTDGTKFDSSYDRGEPFGFELGAGKVIQGWDLGLMGMKEGGKRHLVIPAALAYGDRSPSKLIPPNSTLVFDVELVRVMQARENVKK